MSHLDVAMASLESSNIAAVGYDAESKVLLVRFKTGSTYAYDGVPAHEHAALLRAESKGGYLRSSIIPGYTCRRLNERGKARRW